LARCAEAVAGGARDRRIGGNEAVECGRLAFCELEGANERETVMAIIDRDSSDAGTCSLSVAFLLAAVSTAAAGSLGGPLELQDEGSFFVGGRPITSAHLGTGPAGPTPPGEIMVGQMYVQFRIPKTVGGPPIIMVPGSGHTGATYESTPDGREGWATYFARKNFPVYVVDHAGRARSGFDPTPVNRAKAEASAPSLPEFPLATRERAWSFFRVGPSYPTPHPGTQFPIEALDQYFSQLVPNTESTLPGGGANTVKALAALLDKIGPAVVLVHSQSGAYGMDLARNHADKVRALVNVEGNCVPATADEIVNTFSKVPMLAVWGDFSEGAPGPNGDTRRNGCVATISALKAAGGTAKLLLLPEAGHKGNSHMLMMDKNNLQIADMIIAWIGESARDK
jgi:pimeloyl-ACP methyl ester carboxylesterase